MKAISRLVLVTAAVLLVGGVSLACDDFGGHRDESVEDLLPRPTPEPPTGAEDDEGHWSDNDGNFDLEFRDQTRVTKASCEVGVGVDGQAILVIGNIGTSTIPDWTILKFTMPDGTIKSVFITTNGKPGSIWRIENAGQMAERSCLRLILPDASKPEDVPK